MRLFCDSNCFFVRFWVVELVYVFGVALVMSSPASRVGNAFCAMRFALRFLTIFSTARWMVKLA